MPARTGRGFPSHIPKFIARFAQSAQTISFTSGATFIQRSLNPANYTGTVTAYLEVHGQTSGPGFTAHLQNITLGAPVSDAVVNLANTTKTRARSGAFSLDAGENVYEVEWGGAVGGLYTLYDAVVILVFS